FVGAQAPPAKILERRQENRPAQQQRPDGGADIRDRRAQVPPGNDEGVDDEQQPNERLREPDGRMAVVMIATRAGVAGLMFMSAEKRGDLHAKSVRDQFV